MYLPLAVMRPKTEEAYKFYAATGAQPLRQDVRRNFPFAGIVFEEYAGTVTLSTKATERLVPANEGIAFPLGTMDTFTTYGGPAIVSRAALAYDATVDDGAKITTKIGQLAAVGIIARDGV